MPPRLKFSFRFVGVTQNYLLDFSGSGTLKSLLLKVKKWVYKLPLTTLSELIKRFGEGKK